MSGHVLSAYNQRDNLVPIAGRDLCPLPVLQLQTLVTQINFDVAQLMITLHEIQVYTTVTLVSFDVSVSCIHSSSDHFVNNYLNIPICSLNTVGL